MAEDEITDSWEDLEDSGELDKRIEKFAAQAEKQKDKGTHGESKTVMEEGDRTSYQPQVRILKRQPNPTNNADAQAKKMLNKPSKSLAEREAAYAEARLRILGAPKHDDDKEPAASTSEQDRPQRLIQQMEGAKITENVVRQPKGPDGSKGFTKQQDKPS